MNPYTNPAYLEQLHRDAALHRSLEIVRTSDRNDWQAAQRQLATIAARWIWGTPQAKLRDARGLR